MRVQGVNLRGVAADRRAGGGNAILLGSSGNAVTVRQQWVRRSELGSQLAAVKAHERYKAMQKLGIKTAKLPGRAKKGAAALRRQAPQKLDWRSVDSSVACHGVAAKENGPA